MAYIDIFLASKEEQIIQRLTIACADVARDVFIEDVGVTGHETRVMLVPYAGPRTTDFRRFAEEIALLVLLLNPTLGVNSTDVQLKTAVAGMWTVYAKILVSKGLITVPAATV